mmetsp:Transcript_26044/g.37353  ORF Transcript_26044/g.37353 Transcript_26044/m.37353 type:complete len:161 (+) Transcript_26044:112-594(+)
MDRDLAKKKPTMKPIKRTMKPAPKPKTKKPVPAPMPKAPTYTKDWILSFTPGGVAPDNIYKYAVYWEIYKDGVSIANGNSAFPAGNEVNYPSTWISAPALTLSQGSYTLKYDCAGPPTNNGNSFSFLLGSDCTGTTLLTPSGYVCPEFFGFCSQSWTFTV